MLLVTFSRSTWYIIPWLQQILAQLASLQEHQLYGCCFSGTLMGIRVVPMLSSSREWHMRTRGRILEARRSLPDVFSLIFLTVALCWFTHSFSIHLWKPEIYELWQTNTFFFWERATWVMKERKTTPACLYLLNTFVDLSDPSCVVCKPNIFMNSRHITQGGCVNILETLQ